MRNAIIYIAIGMLLPMFLGCEKDDSVIPQCIDCSNDSLLIDTTVAVVYIMNEGNYGWNNSSLSMYYPNLNLVQNNVYQSANGVIAGDVMQSMTLIGNSGFLVLNNSDKIDVLDMNTLKVQGVVNGISTPRYVKQISQTEALVSSLFGNKVYWLDLRSLEVIKTTEYTGWTEQIELVYENIFIVSPDQNKLLVLNRDGWVKEIEVGEFPNSMVLDKHNNIWVLSSGGDMKELAQLVRVNPETLEIDRVFSFSNLSDSPSNLCINAYRDRLVFESGGIYEMNIDDQTLPSENIVSKRDRNIYGLGVAPNGDIYFSDALDYTQSGYVYRYHYLKQTLDSFSVGIIPGSFTFN